MLATKILHHGFGAGSDMEFFIDPAEMTAHGQNANGQDVGDLFVTIALGQVSENFIFPVRKIISDFWNLAALLKV